MKNLLKPSIYWLIAFIPITIISELGHASEPLIFFGSTLHRTGWPAVYLIIGMMLYFIPTA